MKKYIVKSNEGGFKCDYVFFSMEDAEARVLEYNKYHDERGEEHGHNAIMVEEENLELFEKQILLPESILVEGAEYKLQIDHEYAKSWGHPAVSIQYMGQKIDLTFAIAMLELYIERWNELQTLKNECWRGMTKYIVNDCILRRIFVNLETGLWRIELPFTTSAYLDCRAVYSEWLSIRRCPRGGLDLYTENDPYIGFTIYF